MPKKVFISYRRQDSKWPTDRLFQALMKELPSGFVFMDTDVIPFGVDFVEYFDFWIRQCRVFLAVIGPNWLDAVDPKTGDRRLDDPSDFVRVEIRQALLRNIEVVPVLLDGTAMPEPERLPPDIRPLAYRNAASIEHRTVNADTDRLIRRLRLWEDEQNASTTGDNSPRRIEQRPEWLEKEGTDAIGPFQRIAIAGQSTLFRWIPPGSFQMGSAKGDAEAFDDETAHEVTITKGFWMATTPCTQALWEAMTGKKPSAFEGADRPVENVTWEEVQVAITELNRRMPGLDARLPTEAQWEYACRAGSQGSRHGNLDEVAWYDANSGDETHPVAAKAANAWGLYDTLGNVYEWCADCLRRYSEQAAIDPKGSAPGSHPCVRGGSFSSPAAQVRAAERSLANRVAHESRQGFRLARGTAIARLANLQQQDQPERAPQRDAGAGGDQASQMLPVTTPIALEIAADLIPLVEDQSDRSFLNGMVPMMRDGLFYELGVKFPGVRVRGNEGDLPAGTYIIMINEIPRARGNVTLDHVLVNDTVDHLKTLGIEATPTENPANGAPSAWIRAQDADRAENAGLTTWDAAGYMTLHLSSILRSNAATFVGIQEVANMLEQLEQAFPALIQEATKLISMGKLTDMLNRMVAEELSIRDLRSILQTLVDAYDPTLDAVALTEIVRSHSKVYITHKYSHGEPTLDCQLLAPETEAVLRGHLQGARTDLQATLPPDFVRALFSAIRFQVGGERPTSPTPVIVTAPELRPYLRDLLKEDFPHLAILSRAEISDDVELKPTGSISVPTPGDPPKPESD